MVPWKGKKVLEKAVEHGGCLFEQFETNPQMIEYAVLKDDFLLKILINGQNDCVYVKGQRKDVFVKNLSHQTNRQSVKVIVSAALTWFEVTKPLFVNKKELKSILKIIVNILEKNYVLLLIRPIHEKIEFSFNTVQRPIPAISFKVSALQNRQTAILWIITFGTRLRRKCQKSD